MVDFNELFEVLWEKKGFPEPDPDSPNRIIVECWSSLLTEGVIRRIGRHQIRRDPPHTGTDRYHAHCQLGGWEVCWDDSGKRRHPNKFPPDTKIPYDVKQAIADLLGIKADILESWLATDEDGRDAYVITIREQVV